MKLEVFSSNINQNQGPGSIRTSSGRALNLMVLQKANMQKANSYKKPNYCKKQTYYESKHILQKANTYEKANTAKTKPILILDR